VIKGPRFVTNVIFNVSSYIFWLHQVLTPPKEALFFYIPFSSLFYSLLFVSILKWNVWNISALNVWYMSVSLRYNRKSPKCNQISIHTSQERLRIETSSYRGA
jgi:uncharacterized membrane protein